jgi:predicted transcriptional regulator
MATITIQLDPSVEARLIALAQEQDRSTAEVAAELIASHFLVALEDERKIREAMAEFDGGFEGIPHEQVDAWLVSWGTENELPPPQ